MSFLIALDIIVRFVTFLIIIFLLFAIQFNIKTEHKDLKTINNFLNKRTMLLILMFTVVIFCLDFFVFSIKPGDKKIKDEYCKNKKEKLDNVEDNVETTDKTINIFDDDNVKNIEPKEVQESNTYNISEKIKFESPKDDEEEIEMEYVDANHLYVPPDYKSKTEDLGYYYLMPEKWYPTPPVPPVCLGNKQKYYISPTIAYNVNLKKVNKPM